MMQNVQRWSQPRRSSGTRSGGVRRMPCGGTRSGMDRAAAAAARAPRDDILVCLRAGGLIPRDGAQRSSPLRAEAAGDDHAAVVRGVANRPSDSWIASSMKPQVLTTTGSRPRCRRRRPGGGRVRMRSESTSALGGRGDEPDARQRGQQVRPAGSRGVDPRLAEAAHAAAARRRAAGLLSQRRSCLLPSEPAWTMCRR